MATTTCSEPGRGAVRPAAVIGFVVLVLLGASFVWLGAVARIAVARGAETWERLPDLPRPLSGHATGVSHGAVIVAGGTDFPVPLFEGGRKVWFDTIFVLAPGARAWSPGPALSHPLAYAAAATIDDAFVMAGGSDSTRHYADAFVWRWIDGRVERESLPAMPEPIAMAGAAAIGHTLFVVGGQRAPDSREALRTLWALDLSASPRAWRALDPIPGPARMLPVVVAQRDSLIVISGAELIAGDNGVVRRRYLTDAYAYTPASAASPARGWRRIADVPKPVVAAPAIASGESDVLVFGGDDGALADRVQELRDRHPGFSRDVLAYHTNANAWSTVDTMTSPAVVTTMAVRRGDRVMIAGGEDRPGHRVVAVHEGNTQTAQTASQAEEPTQTNVYVAGQEGYHTFRIPSVILTPKGTLLAFAEGRRGGQGDTGDIDLVVKRSVDGGATWSALEVIGDNGPGTFGNPCPVVDRDTGTIWLLTTHNRGEDKEPQILDGTSTGTRTVWVMSSDDDGRRWSTPKEITASVKRPEWTWYATGPGIGIQTRTGRLVIPANHAMAGTRVHQSHLFYSDDHGKTWTLGGIAADGTNESQVVELADGRLMLNMRNLLAPPGRRGDMRGEPASSGAGEANLRAVAISGDGGRTLGETTYDRALVEPPAQASLIRYAPGRLLFANPAGPGRTHMTLRLSEDDGRTWPIARVMHDGPAAYSSLVVLPDETIGLLCERGDRSPYETLTFARVSLRWLTGARSTLPPRE